MGIRCRGGNRLRDILFWRTLLWPAIPVTPVIPAAAPIASGSRILYPIPAAIPAAAVPSPVRAAMAAAAAATPAIPATPAAASAVLPPATAPAAAMRLAAAAPATNL